jgi:serine/threonine protein phosphatase PrpC
MTTIKFAALSEHGLRPRNDDAYCAEKIGDYYVFALAGGLAGHPYGDVASTTAIEALRSAVKTTRGSAREVLLAAVRKADAEIASLSAKSPKHASLVTQLVACLIDKKQVCTVLDVGDKNCTVITGTTVGPAGSRAGTKTPAGPAANPQPPSLSEMVSHVLGEPYRLKDSSFSEFVLGDEFLLLSSDGLTDALSREAIATVVRNADGNIEVACEKLVQEALSAGSDSTITVILVHPT